MKVNKTQYSNVVSQDYCQWKCKIPFVEKSCYIENGKWICTIVAGLFQIIHFVALQKKKPLQFCRHAKFMD